MALGIKGTRLLFGGAVWWTAFGAAASCSEHHESDDDDSSGEAGAIAMAGASSARGGNSSATTGGKGSGTTGGDGSGATGATSAGGTENGAGQGNAAGGSSPGGEGSGASGGTNPGSGGTQSSNAGAGGEPDCAGAGCPVCGDKLVEGSEACDDGNLLPFDGCSPACTLEPACEGADCAGTCGDGILVSGEACDDGNTKDGDGCSSHCSVEGGYTCSPAECEQRDGHCIVRLPVVFRDFNASSSAGGHPDFEPGVNSDGAVQGLVLPELDSDGKPVLSSTASASVAAGFMHGATAFAEWYRDEPPSSGPIPGELVLWDDDQGGFVNRWGAKGERWLARSFPTYCGPADDCSDCLTPSAGTCLPCSDIANYYCLVNETSYDGNPLFFPIDTAKGILNDERLEAKVPEQYGWAGWPWEPDVAGQLGVTTPIPTATAPFPSNVHNFSFTTELKFWFRYDESKNQILTFMGDDDMWLFVNGHLAGDLGGWHVPLQASVTIAGGMVTSVASLTDTTHATKTATVADFGLENGKIYQVAVFHAERQSEGSSFKLDISGLDATPSHCVKN
ncbi:MAG TPA: fibro-slime domain-containing protein [Polyangiaceae bacterium]|jgi:fibro-slime domain-containing protein|nr:fibro-slime domain-containing protein [Polyangiaceae bacterium]